MASEQPLGTALDWRPARRPERSPLEGRHVLLRALDAAADAEVLYAESHPPAADPGIVDLPSRRPLPRCPRHARRPRGGRSLGGPTVLHPGPPARRPSRGRGVLPAHHARAGSDRDRPHLVRRVAAPDQSPPPRRSTCSPRMRSTSSDTGDSSGSATRSTSPRAGPPSDSASASRACSASHMVVKGRNRDTAWYAITDEEWPAVRAGFDALARSGQLRCRRCSAAQTGRADRRRARLARSAAR